jgi:hypothetical protein
MRRFWPPIYCVGAALSVVGGYQSLASDKTTNTNAEWIFVTICFVLMCLLPLGAMAYSRRIGVETFRRPSLDRQPFGWWRDTLQPLRVSLVGTGLFFIGACLALPHTDHRGVMLVWFYVAVVFGLFFGERLVYYIYRERIA